MANPKSFFLKSLLLAAAALLTLSLSSCGSQNTGTDTHKTTHISVDSGNRSGATDSNRVADAGLTLPVLNALFFEEGFEGDLKSKLNITAAQIAQLKTASGEAVSELSEDGDYTGSGRTAVAHANERLRGILGEEKAAALIRLIGERYNSGEIAGMMPTRPNSVPTDTRIVVNAPAFRMDVFEEGRLTKTYRIGIGYPEFPLPTGMRRAETIIFNPTWTPPDEPWVKGKFKPGQKVDAGSKDNPLGPIKIPIGAPSLIHGGKQPARLGNFASHGCVGLTNDGIREFAGLVAQLSGSPLTADSILAIGAGKSKTRNYRLAKPLAVELRYETIVADNGNLHIYRDVYERGTNTVENARRVLDVYGISLDALPANEKQMLMQALTQMNRDPQGKPIVQDPANATDTSATAASPEDLDSGRKDGVAPSKVARAKKGKTTSTIVGQKELVVPIAQLGGKGYPAPVNLNAGTPAPKNISASR